MSESLFIFVVRGPRSPLRVALLTAALATAACHKRAPRVFVPPVVRYPAPQPLKLPANLNPPEMAVEVASLDQVADLTAPAPEILPPPAPPPPPKPRAPIVAAPKPVLPPAPEAQPPKIVQIFPAEQQRAYNREIDEIMERDQKILETVARKNLNADMKDRMAQIHELLAQAKQAREQDLVTAVSLATRADTLAKDLLARLP